MGSKLGNDRHFDVCIVGSGGGGAVAAAELAAAGWEVAVIEQGDHVAPGSDLRDLLPSHETARARRPDGVWVEYGNPWAACAVGGGTRFFAGLAWRFRNVDFDPGTHLAADALPTQWPITYDQLRPHYDAVEATIGVARDESDPLLPAAAPPVMPAHPYGARGELLHRAATSLGLHPFPTPLAVASVATSTRKACAELTTCTYFACPTGAKGGVVERVLDNLLAMPNFSLFVRIKAVALEAMSRDLVHSLRCVDLISGRPITVRSRLFILAANAVQTAALLLRSTSRHAPSGIGNDNDLVGRGLCFKASQYIRARLDAAQPQTGRHSSIAISDYYLDDSCPTGLGGMIYDVGPTDPSDDQDRHLVRLECLLADQPLARNRVLLDPASTDSLGLPRIVMDYRPHKLDLARLAHMREHAITILHAAGARELTTEPIDFTLGSAHLHGTCRFGVDPRTSVCDPDGRVHTMNNLYIADGSLLPYPGGVNPSLTIQALARHVAHRLLDTHSTA
ncbi:GMC oxidoreductase [Nocardia sp. NPDC101769]|uniref:GMC oxidoreductase n=1 Tax=Nocardia sp. NPDC101769 TaxID=3364333 RepID=UPI0038101393